MTIYDLVFLLLLAIAIVTLVAAGVSAFRGRRRQAMVTLRRLMEV